ncbi:hypothetical protein AB0933_32265 [Streptomyces venezuelae]|uniref:hypothetical protein n=1 Tax=Streptomyces venezuelae TaxID=54571 RepID=UPI0034559F95
MATQAPATTPQSQHTHHYILTLQHQRQAGSVRLATFNAAVTLPAGMTRAEFYKGLYTEMTTHHDLPGAQTLFFALEPNQL